MHNLTPKLAALSLATAMAVGSQAQETTAEISGQVTNGGSSVAGATITALHQPTGTVYTTTSRKDGLFNLPNLRVGGPYQVTATYVGFNTVRKDSINLLLGQEFKLQFDMTASTSDLENVVVRSNRQDRVFNNSRTGSQEIINRQQIERLPTINRSLQDFTRLTPSSNGLSFGGRSGLYNNLTVDGANFNNAFGLSGTLGGQTSSQPISLDAIEQIQVNINPYDVRQGGFSGAGINSVTRSGTNQFKGTVYTYLRSPGLQGYDVRTVKVPKPEFDYNLRGAALGGALVKNKLFFFVSFEQERVSQPATQLLARRGSQTAVPGAISQVSADSLDQLKRFLVERFGYDPGSYENYNYRTQSDKVTARLDYNLNSKNVITLKYNYLKSFREIAASNSGAPNNFRQPGNFGLPFSGSGYVINNNFNIFIAELNTKFSNRLNNKFQIGYSALRDFRAPLSEGSLPMVDILNSIGQTATSFGYEPFTFNNKLNSDIFQVSNILTYYAGRHELTVGTQNYVKRFQNGFAPNYQGIFAYASFQDFYNSVNNGAPNARRFQQSFAATKDGSFPFANIGVTELGFFIQDKWKARKNLTVTLGLRADLPLFQNNFLTNDSAAVLAFRDGKRYSTGTPPSNSVLFSPRLGFNWDVFNNQRTQLRGGVGIFAGPPPFVWISNQAGNNGVQFGSIDIVPGVGGVPANDPRFAFNPAPRAGAPGQLPTQYNLVFTDESFKYPTAFKGSVALDQKLPGDITLTAEYQFSADINAVNFENVNLPATGTAFNGLDNRIRYSSQRIWAGLPQRSLSNPNIVSAILMKNYNRGYAYTATLQAQKSFKNLFASVAYTFSEAKSLNDGGSIAASMWRDRPVTADPNAPELGFANFYQPHRVIAQANYRKEYGKFFATSIGVIFEAAPNSAGSYTYQGDMNNDGTGGNNDLMYIPASQADIVLVPVNTGGGTITDTRTPNVIWNQLNNFINQDPYLSQRRGQFAERNAALSPFFKRVDLNVTQDFYIKSGKDRHTLRLTFDLINAGNLLNKNWGIYRNFTNLSPLRYEGIVPASDPVNGGKPRFSFPYLDAANQIPLVNSFQDVTSIISRWQGQVGIRYLFN